MENLLKEIRTEIPDFPNMDDACIKEVHDALFSEMNHEREFREAPVKSKKSALVALPKSDAPISVQKIMDESEKYGATAYWMKTGLSVKVVNESGYKLNIMNYLNVRDRNGIVSGDLYLNQIRNERLAEPIEGLPEYSWFKGYLCAKKVTSDQLLAFMGDSNMDYLVKFGFDSLNNKKSKAKNLKSRIRKK